MSDIIPGCRERTNFISRYIMVHEKLTIMTLVGTEAYDT